MLFAEEWMAAAAAGCLCNFAACASLGDTSSSNKPHVITYAYTWLIEAKRQLIYGILDLKHLIYDAVYTRSPVLPSLGDASGSVAMAIYI